MKYLYRYKSRCSAFKKSGIHDARVCRCDEKSKHTGIQQHSDTLLSATGLWAMFKAHACYLSASRTPVQVSLVSRRISRVGHAYQIIAFAVSRARKVHPIARTCFLRRQGSVKAHARIKKNKSKNTKKRKKEKKKQEKSKERKK